MFVISIDYKKKPTCQTFWSYPSNPKQRTSSEGKTWIASALAGTFALSGRQCANLPPSPKISLSKHFLELMSCRVVSEPGMLISAALAGLASLHSNVSTDNSMIFNKPKPSDISEYNIWLYSLILCFRKLFVAARSRHKLQGSQWETAKEMRMHAWISGREQEDDIQKTLKHLSASLPCVFHYIILLPFTWYYLANPFSTMTMTVCHVAYITRQKRWIITPSLCPAMQPYFQVFTYSHIIHTYSSRFMHLYLHIYQTSSDSISGSKHAHQKLISLLGKGWERKIDSWSDRRYTPKVNREIWR